MALSYKRQDYNTNISYMGKMRQHLLCPDLAFLKAVPVSSVAHKSLYTSCIDSSAELTWRRITRLDTSSQPDTSKGGGSYVDMGNIMRCPSRQLRKEETETEVIPYFFIRALNLGLAPPRRERTNVVLFTDPWRKDQGEVKI